MAKASTWFRGHLLCTPFVASGYSDSEKALKWGKQLNALVVVLFDKTLSSLLDQGWTITKILVPFQLQYFPKISTIMVSISILNHLICNINFDFNITICRLKYRNQFQYYQRFSAISVWISIFPNEFCNIIMTSIIPNYSNNSRNDFNIAR